MAEEDLIFGKKRHLFGGIEPSNMVKFEVIDDGTNVFVSATPPSDSIVDGQTLCTVAGAIVRRKENDFPKDEFDGDFVADIKNETVFKDTTALSGNTYFYSAFPYSSQDVYNRNKENRVVINGVEPVESFTIENVYDGNINSLVVNLNIKLPNSVAGAIILKKLVNYPESENDGERISNITSSGIYTDSNVEKGEVYYYSVLTYNENNVFYHGDAGRGSVKTESFNYYFGFDINIGDSNPNTRVIYPSDVENYGYIPAKMDYSSKNFDYGGWNITPGEKFMPRPCMLKNDGIVAYYLNPNDYGKKYDGGVSDISNLNFNGNAMMEWPKIYTKRWREGEYYKFRCSDVPFNDDWDCWCNYDINNNQTDHFYTGIYLGYFHSGVLRSISKKDIEISTKSATKLVSMAKENGDKWDIDILADRLLIQDLLILMSKTTNLQAAYGVGSVKDLSTTLNGLYDNKGMFFGDDDEYTGVKVFGMEHFWGNYGRVTQGLIYKNQNIMYKITRGTHDGTSSNEYTFDGVGYKTTRMSTPSDGYISNMHNYKFGRIPDYLSGSSSTYECDYVYRGSGSYPLVAEFGGSPNRSYYYEHGPFALFLTQSATNTLNNSSTSLSYKPNA